MRPGAADVGEGETTVAVVGASGFVGTSVVAALSRQAGAQVVRITAPRLLTAQTGTPEAQGALHRLRKEIGKAQAVVNAAGVSDATGGDEAMLLGGNTALPSLLAQLTASTGARLVHVSSAAVQGRTIRLDASFQTDEFSPYSRSKAMGERAVLAHGGRYVIYRPPGVHAPDRQVSRTIAHLARSRAASVAAPGDAPSPQALAENVGAAIAYLATCKTEPPRIVIHPSEGVTTSSLLTDLGGKPPVLVPAPLARLVVRSATALGRLSPRVAGNARRLEMMWFGQLQDESWLTQQGWSPPVGREGWQRMGRQLASMTEDEQGL